MATKKSHIVGSADLTLTVNIPADLNLIQSDPGSGEYQIKKLRLDSSKHIVVVYDEDAEE